VSQIEVPRGPATADHTPKSDAARIGIERALPTLVMRARRSFKVDVIQSEVVGGEAGDIYQPIEIANVYAALTPGGTSGFYHVNLEPSGEFRWGRSRIVVGLAVSRAASSRASGFCLSRRCSGISVKRSSHSKSYKNSSRPVR